MAIDNLLKNELITEELIKKYKIDENMFKKSFFKQLVFELIFLLLPVRILKIYLTLSLTAFICKVKNITFNIDNINVKKISSILKITLNNDLLIIPYLTYNWIWNEDILLNKEIIYHEQMFKLKDFLLDDKLFVHHFQATTKVFVDSLPAIFKFKLGLFREKNKIKFQNLLVRNILYSLS